MDVTCTRCSTVYEFDEGLISTTGTTVKCTQCGHLFKVHRPGSTSERPADAEAIEPRELRWRVRRTDGSTHTLESLAELTRLAAAGQFTRQDEISRTGQVWRRLGDIKELASLFESPPPARPRRASEMSAVPAAIAGPPAPPSAAGSIQTAVTVSVSADGVAPRARLRTQSERFQVMGAEVPIEATEPQPAAVSPSGADGEDQQTSKRAPAPAAPAANAAPAAIDEPGDTRESEAVTQPLPLAREALPFDDDALPLPPRPSRLWPWLAAAAVLAAAVGVGGAYLTRPPPPAPAEPPSRAYLQRADEAFDAHLPSRFDEAIAEYSKALAFHADDPHILSSISRVYAVWSEWLRLQYDISIEADEPDQDALEALQVEARRLADEAKLYGERAAQRNPGNEEAGVALSDALRLTGNLVAARGELDRARATEGVAPAETLRVAALLAIDEADGDLRAGRTLAEQAVARDPALIRARVLLARCLAEDGDFEGARMHLDDARRDGRPHAILDEVRAAIDRVAQRVEEPAASEPAAAPAKAAQPQAPAGGPSQPQPTQPSSPPAKRAAARPPGDAQELARKGDAALERGAVHAAQRLFEEALAIEQGLPRARTGLGYVALERSQPRMALGHFRPAARSGHPEALIGMGDAYRRLGRMRDALAAYKQYLRSFPRGERRSIAQRQVELLTEQLNEAR